MKSALRAAVVLGVCVGGAFAARTASAAPVTDPDDPRTWQGASVGTFAQLYYGSNTLANRQLVIDNYLLDDGIFNTTGYSAGTLTYATATGVGGFSYGSGHGVNAYDYGLGGDVFTNANGIDNLWIQTSGTIGHTVWDLGFQATKAAVFNTIDHGTLPYEAIESTVYLSNGAGVGQNPSDPTTWTWTQAVTYRVWLEGFHADTNIDWDGFSYVVTTGTSGTFRYASVIWGGPGALIADGDNEINGIMGLNDNLTQEVPLPGAAWMGFGLLGGLGLVSRLRSSRRATIV